MNIQDNNLLTNKGNHLLGIRITAKIDKITKNSRFQKSDTNYMNNRIFIFYFISKILFYHFLKVYETPLCFIFRLSLVFYLIHYNFYLSNLLTK